MTIPSSFLAAAAGAGAGWQPVLAAGLARVEAAHPGYLAALANDAYLPTDGRIFAAFAQPLAAVRRVLVGEGPYPRAASATGFCFMDGAVGSLWAPGDGGLSREVNRATSLRNFIKMLLVAGGALQAGATGAPALAAVARALRAGELDLVETLQQLQENMLRHGFLLLNASLVFRPHVAPAIDARAWQPFLEQVLDALLARQDAGPPPVLILWGKLAAEINRLSQAQHFPQVVSEHPYNLSFIDNQQMQQLFGPLSLLQKQF